MDLTPLLENRVHLHGFDCAPLRALRLLRAAVGMMPGGPKVVWWERTNTNPAKVACVSCFDENAEVKKAFGPRS